jgi:hypothetical protein
MPDVTVDDADAFDALHRSPPLRLGAARRCAILPTLPDVGSPTAQSSE